MGVEFYSIQMATGASTTSNASMRNGIDKLWLQVKTFSLTGTTGTILYVYGGRTSSDTFFPIQLTDPNTASLTSDLGGKLGRVTHVGGYLLDCTPAVGLPFLNVNITSAVSGAHTFIFIASSRNMW